MSASNNVLTSMPFTIVRETLGDWGEREREESEFVAVLVEVFCRFYRLSRLLPTMEKYTDLHKIGGGSFSEVFKAIDRDTKEIVAIKKVTLDEEGISGSLLREVALLKMVEHPNIVRLLDVIHEGKELHLVFEHLESDLKKKINNDPEYFEPDVVKDLLRRMLQAVDYCHGQAIIHRDLKPQNILFDSKRDVLKLADFGLARFYDIRREVYTPKVVTLYYRAPEILLGIAKYNYAVDIWAMGCIFAEMVNQGNPLFRGRDELEQLSRIFSVMGAPKKEIWPEVESSLKPFHKMNPKELGTVVELDPAGLDLLSKMLKLNPKKRISAKKALEHSYFMNAD